jgi:hypothetical protein
MQMWDPKTKQMTTIDTCFGTHHLNFDDNDKLWFTGSGQQIAWFDTKVYLATKDEAKAQGWSAFVLDTNGNGKRDAYVGITEAIDPTKDKRIAGGFYGVAPSPLDGSIWGSVLGMPGALVRVVPGPDPTTTALSEIYEVPWNNPKASVQGFAPRGMDVDSNGVVWTVLSSGQLASFDRRKCKGPLNGPTATGSTVLKAGRFTRCQDRTTKVQRIRPAPIPPTTTSWTGSTCSVSGRTCRLRPATSRKRCLRWSTASS